MYKNTFFLLFFISIPFLLPAQCWNLIWEDNFDGSSLDLTKWTPQIGAGGWGNNELQYYTDRSNNIVISGGNLQIIAQEEAYMGSNYTSARLRSINQGDWKYGRFEARLKTPIGQGIWPAFWMLSTDSPYGIWPQNGEIDIMELVGHQPTRSWASFHYGTAGNLQTQSVGYTLASGTYHDNFHIFALEWTPTELRFYIDGTLYFTGTKASTLPFNWPFDQKFHFLLNIAVGGNWPGAPDATTSFPQVMEVDYVRVYQLLADLTIEGKDLVLPNELNSKYTLPNISNTTYQWSIPTGASFVSGQNTNEIIINWGTSSGQVHCEVNNACGVNTSTIDVIVSPNMLLNYGFEDDFTNWVNRTDNGGNANFNIVTSNVQEGLKSACVDVVSTGVNNWDIQLIHGDLYYINGVDYTFNFWAKGDVSGRQITTAFINPTTFVLYNVKGFTLTDTWAKYTYTFTASTTSAVQMNVDLGQSTGTYCFDDFLFTKTALLPIQLVNFESQLIDNQSIKLSWVTLSEQNNSHFEIEKIINGHAYQIGKINSQGNANQAVNYSFIDVNPIKGYNFYRLKQVDFDGKISYAPTVSTFLAAQKIDIYPNPTSGKIWIEGIRENSTSYEIFTPTGSSLQKGKINAHEIDISTQENGVFILKIWYGQVVTFFRIIKS